MSVTKPQQSDVGAVISAGVSVRRGGSYARLTEFGEKIGRLYTDRGFPVDMAMDRLKPDYTEDQMIVILSGACNWFVEHKRRSGAPEKALDRQRRENQRLIASLLAGNELGLY